MLGNHQDYIAQPSALKSSYLTGLNVLLVLMKIDSFKTLKDYVEKNRVKLEELDSYSLDRIKKLLKKLDNPQDKFKVVHIAGTSGKTSTCYYLAKLLNLNGYKTGLMISPHLEEINERAQINSEPIAEEEFCKNFDKFIKIISPFGIKLTYFEIFVAFAFWYFERAKVDYVVAEVGVGGLYDGTNTINRRDKICVITDIGLDHISMLGDTIEKIAAQKAGIIQTGNKVFCNQQDQTVMGIFNKTAKSKNAELVVNPKNNFLSFSERNFSLAKLIAAEIFREDSKHNLDDKQLEEAASLVVPGRMEEYYLNGKNIILDGAHNSQKIENLLESLNGINLDDCCVVIAVSENKKDHLLKISQFIKKFASHVILTSFKTKQDFMRESLSPGYLKAYFDDISSEKVFDLDKAIERAMDRPEKTILFTGSLYMVGPVRTKLKKTKL